MSTFAQRIRISVLCGAVAALALVAPGRSDAVPPPGFGPAHQVGSLTSCIGQSSTAADGTDVVFSEGGTADDVTFNAVVRRPGTAGWHTMPKLHVPAHSIWDTRMVAIGRSDVLLAVAWYDAGNRPRFSLYRLATRAGKWSAPSNAFPQLGHGNYENATVGVTAAGGIVAATTYQTFDTTYHYAVMVAYRAAGSTAWQRATYTSPTSWQFANQLAVSRNGYVAVPFTVEDTTGSTQTGAGVITRSPGSTHWRRQVLDTSGTVARPTAAVGADGEALFAFSSSTANSVQVARTVMAPGNTLPTWSTQTVTSSTGFKGDSVFAAVDGRGHGTLVIDDHTPPLYAHLSGATLTGPFPLDNGARRDILGITVRPDGTAVASATDYTGSTPTFTGADAIRFPSNGSSSVTSLETVGNPWSNGHTTIELDSDAANRMFATFTTGATTPDTCQYVDQPGKPDVMTSPSSGRYVTHTHTHRLSGGRLRCVSGFWVEAHALAYRWFRSGHRIVGATHAVYRLVAKDHGHHITCAVRATNRIGTRVLKP